MFKKTGGKIEYSDLQELQYLEMCIKESLRLYPSVPFISRKLTKDLKLSMTYKFSENQFTIQFFTRKFYNYSLTAIDRKIPDS